MIFTFSAKCSLSFSNAFLAKSILYKEKAGEDIKQGLAPGQTSERTENISVEARGLEPLTFRV